MIGFLKTAAFASLRLCGETQQNQFRSFHSFSVISLAPRFENM